VVAGGRLAASGKLSELLAFQLRGWELVVADVTAEALERARPHLKSATEISAGRYMFELSAEQPPERLLPDLASAGASLVSLNPVRDSLEDFFMQRVAEVGRGARDNGDSEAADTIAASRKGLDARH
jgi:hypothetical protein